MQLIAGVRGRMSRAGRTSAGLVARVRAQPQVAAVLEKEKRALGLD